MPRGANFAVDGASICTEPSCSASISSLSLYSDELGKTSIVTLPLVYFSASSLNFSAPLPLGVSLATTWLKLMTIGHGDPGSHQKNRIADDRQHQFTHEILLPN